MRLELHDRPNLDRAGPRRRNASGDLDGFVQVLRVDQVVTSELFLGLGKRAVGGGDFALPDANRRGGLRRLQRVAADVLAALLDPSVKAPYSPIIVSDCSFGMVPNLLSSS